MAGIAVWKFDVLLHTRARVAAYVWRSDRGTAFGALFAACPGAKILGTGMPLTASDAQAECRPSYVGDIHGGMQHIVIDAKDGPLALQG